MSERGIERGQRLADGRTVAEAVAEDEVEAMTQDIEQAMLDVERSRLFESLALARMRTEWTGSNAAAITQIRESVEDVMLTRFEEAFRIVGDVYEIVREPEVDPDTGEVRTDFHGNIIWKRTEAGGFKEDWSALTVKQREEFLFRITTALFDWEQQAAELWGEAMFAKALWVEAFSVGFQSPERGTVDARTAAGNVASAEDKYFALYLSMLSKRAEALCRSLERIGQRLKDSMGG